jgi:lysophospholipase L1-like esterase
MTAHRVAWLAVAIVLLAAGACSHGPTTPSTSAPLVASPLLKRTRFMAYGDSVTAGEITLPATGLTLKGFPNSRLIQVPAASYPTVLKGLLTTRYTSQSAAITMFNEGLGAEKAEFAFARFVAAYDANRPDVVLLMEGYNDVCCGNGEVGLRVMDTGITSMAAEARHRGARVFIATLAPATWGDRFINEEQKDAANLRLREIAAREGAYLVDIFGALLPNLSANIGIDGMHPTEIGYRLVADAFFAAIQADLEIR